MDMTFDVYQLREKDGFTPKSEHLSNFECWSMIKAYCALHRQVTGVYKLEQTIEDTCVWDGNYLYNTEHQITNDDGRTRLWMTKNGILMLEVWYEDDRSNKLYRCD